MYVRAYTHVAGWHTREGDFTSLLSVVVDRDGRRLEHRGDKDFFYACSKVQHKLKAVEPDKEPWRSRSPAY